MFRSVDVAKLIDALDRICSELGTMADVAEREATRHAYELYFQFRRKLRDADTLSELIEERLGNLEEGRSSELDDSLLQIMTQIVIFQSRALVKFAYVLSANTFLPLGSQDLFEHDIQRLEKIRRRVESYSLTDEAGRTAVDNLAIAFDILTEMAGKAPSILNLGALPEAA
jgi:hypothetical protein